MALFNFGKKKEEEKKTPDLMLKAKISRAVKSEEVYLNAFPHDLYSEY